MVELSAVGRSSFAVTGYTYNPANNSITLTWESEPGATYTVRTSSDLITWDGDLGDQITADAGTTTTRTLDASPVAAPGNPLYFRVEKN